MPTVVLLLSDKRSGSTMLQEELCLHPKVQHVKYSSHTYFETHHWLKAAVMLEKSPVLFSGGKVYRTYGTPAKARSYMIDTIKGNLPNYNVPDANSDLVFDGWEALCAKHSKPVFFEKSPQILANWAAVSLILEWMEKTDYTVKIIGLVRNPMAVQFSAKNLFATKAETRQYGWLEIQKNLLTLKNILPPESFRLIRYEDIVSNPSSTFNDLCDFIGIPHDPKLGAQVNVTSLEKWREDRHYTLQLDSSVVQIAKAFGYSDDDLYNPSVPSKTSELASKTPLFRQWQIRYYRFRNRVLVPIYYNIKARFNRY